MSPPPFIPLAAENEYWADEGIFTSLLNYKTGKPLPSHVELELNPFQYPPQNLPGDLWYLCSGVKKESKFGFWVETGDPCQIFSNSAIHGFRTTLKFYEGRSPHGRKTNWVMQEYRITEKRKNNVTDDTVLCRVFLAVENQRELGCILTGDYLELNDLVDDPSCSTMTSDEYFDSMALLQQIDDDAKKKDSTVRFNLSAPVNSNLVICPVTSVSLENETSVERRDNISESLLTRVNTTQEGKKDGGRRTKRHKIMEYLCGWVF